MYNLKAKKTFWLYGGNLDLKSESCGLAVEHSADDQSGFNPCPMLDGSGVKAMPGSIPTPNSGSLFQYRKIESTGSQMGHTKKIFKKTLDLKFRLWKNE